MSFAGRLARSRILHFALLGGILFAARHSFQVPEPEVARLRREPIVLSADTVRVLEVGFAEKWGRAPNAAQRRALLDQAVLDEMLYREARLLGLDIDDGSVQRRLIEKMRAVSERPGQSEADLVGEAVALGLDDDVVIRRLLAEKMRIVLQQEPGGTPIRDADLQANLESRRTELEQPERITLTHVFLASDSREDPKRDAEQVLARLRAGSFRGAEAAELSDPFPMGTELRAHTRLRLQGRFGKSFADQVFALPAGEWSQPIASPYGVHLVRIEERQPAALPRLEEIRPALTRAVLRERAKQNLARGLARLRALYEVQIAGESGPTEARRHVEEDATRASS